MVNLNQVLKEQIIRDADELARADAETLRSALSSDNQFMVIRNIIGLRKTASENSRLAEEISREGPISDGESAYYKITYRLTLKGQEVVKKDIYGD